MGCGLCVTAAPGSGTQSFAAHRAVGLRLQVGLTVGSGALGPKPPDPKPLLDMLDTSLGFRVQDVGIRQHGSAVQATRVWGLESLRLKSAMASRRTNSSKPSMVQIQLYRKGPEYLQHGFGV